LYNINSCCAQRLPANSRKNAKTTEERGETRDKRGEIRDKRGERREERGGVQMLENVCFVERIVLSFFI